MATEAQDVAIFLDILLGLWCLIHMWFVAKHDFRNSRKLVFLMIIGMEFMALAFNAQFIQDADALQAKLGNWVTFIFLLTSWQINVIAVQNKFLMIFLFWRAWELFKEYVKLGGFQKKTKMHIVYGLSILLFIAGLIQGVLTKPHPNPQSMFDWAAWIVLAYFNYKLTEYQLEMFSDRMFKFLLGFAFTNMLCTGFLFLFNVARTKWSTTSQYGLTVLLVISIIATKFFFLGSTGFHPSYVLTSARHIIFGKQDPYFSMYDMEAIQGKKYAAPEQNKPQEGDGDPILVVDSKIIAGPAMQPIGQYPPGYIQGPAMQPMVQYQPGYVQGPVMVQVGVSPFMGAVVPGLAAQQVQVAPIAMNYHPNSAFNVSIPKNAGKITPISGFPGGNTHAKELNARQSAPIPESAEFTGPVSSIPVAVDNLTDLPPAASEIPPEVAIPSRMSSNLPASALFRSDDGGEMGETALPRPVDVEVVGHYNAPMYIPAGREQPTVSIVSANDAPSAQLGDIFKIGIARRAGPRLGAPLSSPASPRAPGRSVPLNVTRADAFSPPASPPVPQKSFPSGAPAPLSEMKDGNAPTPRRIALPRLSAGDGPMPLRAPPLGRSASKASPEDL